MSKKYIELKKENLIFEGKTEKEKKTNETIYDLCLENDTLYNQNKELKKINASLQTALSITQQKYDNDKARYRRKYKKNRHIIKEFEKWLEEKINTITDTYSQINGNYFRMQPILDTLKECLDKLQEIKEKTNG